MTKWTKKRLGDISGACLGKMLDKEKNKGSFKPYLANLNVQWGEFKLSSLQQMRFENHEDQRYGLEYGDLIICEGGEPGRCAVWRNEVPIMKIQKALHRLRVHSDFCSDFLYYRMFLAGKNKQLNRHFIGSTIKHLTGIGLKDVEFEFPSFKIQKSISRTLRSLDEKIELNNKINTELEAMAKLIYDYWFVQFDFPDANGKPYKSSGGKMIYSPELNREIPDGWIGTRIGHILNTELGGTPSTKIKEYWIGDIPWLNSGEIANFPIIESEEQITGSAINNSAASLMPKGTCVLSITRHLRPSILAVDACANQSVVGIFENKKLKSSFLYPYLKSQIKRLMSLRTGAQQPHINKGIVDDSPIILPPEDVLNSYYEKVDDIYEKINNTAFQNKELTQLRDWLLPMLMNGQVTVR